MAVSDLTGRPGQHPAARWSRRRIAVTTAVTVAGLVLTGLVVRLATSEGAGGRPPQAAEQTAGRVEGCGPLTIGEVRGRKARHLPRALSRFWGDEAICRGAWLGGRKGWFVPQGLAVSGRTGWVTGYDGSAPRSQRPCRLVKVDLRRLEVVAVQSRLSGAVPGRGTTYCRHGGAVVADGPARLWVVETRRLWLLDPELVGTGADPVVRGWLLLEPLRGSVLLEGDDALGAIRALRDRPGDRAIQVWGSSSLALQLVEHDLVDEFRLLIEPILLGGGKTIFPRDGRARPLELISVTQAKTGVLVCAYRPAA